MEDKKIQFEKLYDEYKKLVVSTYIEAQILRPGQSYKVKYIKPEELMRRKELAQELVKKYKDFFEGESAEWFDLQRDAS